MKKSPIIFILGRKPLLSVAEIITYFSEKEILSIGPKTLLISPKTSLKNPQAFLNELGGSIRILKVFRKALRPKNLEDGIEKWTPFLKTYFKERFKKHESKIRFGVNIYNFPHPREIFLKKFLTEVKHALKESGLKVRFVNNNGKNLQSAATIKEKLLKSSGVEINIVLDKKAVYLAETVAVQNVDAYAERDYGKPHRDPRSGMLPPKLAQMMISFARTNALGRTNKINWIYDPFCGTGTILMEGLIKNLCVAGSDIDKEVNALSRKNIEWIEKKHDISKKLKWKVSTLDATKLTVQQVREAFGMKKMPNFAIVAEPYLGPPFFKFPKRQKLEEHMKYLDYLYTKFFERMNEWVKKGTVIIFAFPVWRDEHHDLKLTKTVEKIESLGYSVIDLIPEQYIKKYHIEKPKWPSLLYEREGQIVARDIYKFVKNA